MSARRRMGATAPSTVRELDSSVVRTAPSKCPAPGNAGTPGPPLRVVAGVAWEAPWRVAAAAEFDPGSEELPMCRPARKAIAIARSRAVRRAFTAATLAAFGATPLLARPRR